MAITRRDSANADCLPAAADLREKLYYLCTINSSGQVALCGNQGIVAGVITDGANTGDGCSFSKGPIEKVICGGTITAGERVECDGNGKAVAGTTAVFGVARQGGVANDIIAVDFDRR